MRQFLTPVLAVALLGMASCQKKTAPAPSLEGTWRLTNRQCECAPTPLPDETVTFTPTQFTFYGGSRALRLGQYLLTTAAVRCFNNGTTAPTLQFTYSAASSSLGPATVQYNLDGNTLTLDYGGPCDAPVDTYERLQ
ncbi:hypothetical protein MON38_03420 [Hymenobacter sp. DH14]|uniref:Lipocalin-like domain-containing protein n=1 Tax=Hymenobacter cyanobacteriorum TaxID=2926463 RepID=A0A9X1VE33_9BACT|nr:hypothetical protein [Hymenobacter cyanobacteriorum]MCI1186452.1 hypothetical protein [Hymenobacter cyanobacteriorum]